MQLEAGVRYFDLRIARKRNDHHPTRLYFYHGLYTSTDVEVIISILCKSTRLYIQKYKTKISNFLI